MSTPSNGVTGTAARARRAGGRMSALAALLLGAVGACGGGTTPAKGPKAPTTGEAFDDESTVQCSAFRPQTEPDLMGWDSASRASLNRLRSKGVVAVRYEVVGCDVLLELLPNCIGKGSYEYSAYPSSDTKLMTSAQDVFTELPLGAVKLQGQVSRHGALRTDYLLAGVAALPPGTTYSATELTGPDCGRATHVVSAVYVGGFAMVAGEAQTLAASASVFTAGAGVESSGSAERVAREGDPAQCEQAQTTGEPRPLCSVPLRIGLLAIEGRESSACPAGSAWDAAQARCVATVDATCAEGHEYQEGRGCVAKVSSDCPSGTRFEAGRGCVPVVVAAAPAAAAAPRPAPAAPASVTPSTGATRGATMVSIPGGTFQMGSTSGDSDEKPVHSVSVASFEMDTTEVTVAAYRECVSAGRCSEPRTGGSCNWGASGRDDHPVNCVDWDQATAYCGWAGKRLPTEEEWEYAARGTDGRTYPWGNGAPGSQLCWNRYGDGKPNSTCAVGSYASGASPFGLLDMAGNVWEWTSSTFCSYTATGRDSCSHTVRVNRGGGWSDGDPSNVRAADRRDSPSSRSGHLGFRCAR